MRRLYTVLLVITLSITACKRDEPQQQGGGGAPAVGGRDKILDVDLLKRLPASTVGFMVWDLESPSYQRYKASSLGKVFSDPMAFTKMLEQAQQDMKPEMAGIMGVLNSIRSFGQKDGKDGPESFSRVVTFIGDLKNLSAAGMPTVALYATAKAGVNLKEGIPRISKAAQEAGTTITAEEFPNAQGFSTKIMVDDAATGQKKEIPLFVAASDTMLSISTSKPTAQALFAPPAADAAVPAVMTSPEFEKTLKLLQTNGESSVLGFVSVTRLVQELKASNLIPKEQGVNADLIPFETVAFTQLFDNGLTGKFLATYTPKDDNQRELLKRLTAPSQGAALEKLPSDVAFALNIDGKVISALLPMIPPTNPVPPPALEFFQSLKGLTIAARGNEVGSPFPELLFVLSLTDAEKTSTALKELAAFGMSANGMGQMQWQEKEVAGAKTSFFQTPLGVGVFLARSAANDTLVVASSERGVKDALGTTAAGIGTNLTPAAQALLKDPQRLGALALNFTSLADLIDGVRGSMAMFMGGQGNAAQQYDTASLRKLGTSVGLAAVTDQYFTIVSRTDEAKVVTQ